MSPASLELKAANGPLDRRLFALQVADSSEVLGATQAVAPHFAVFLAWDASSVATEEISCLATLLHNRGLAYLCAFGPGCERVHDTFDEVELELDSARPSQSVIMTTWHKDESLEDALWFFVNNSFPDAAYEDTCRTGIAITIGNTQWATQVADYLSNLPKLNAAVGV
jgi:hypothetical protein